MKFFLAVIFIFFNTFQSKAQEEINVLGDEIYSVVDKKAEPKEGFSAFLSNVANQLDLTSTPAKVDEASFKVQFVVEKDGLFTNFKIIGEDHDYGREVLRVLKIMPAWKPAEYKGNIVRTSYTLPMKLRFPMRKLDRLTYNKMVMDKRIETNNFEFDCDCSLISHAKREANKSEEFTYTTTANDAFYSIVLKEKEAEQIEFYKNQIKSEIEKQGGILNKTTYKDLEAIETTVVITNGAKQFYSSTLYFVEGNYFVSLNVISPKKEVLEFNYEDLKKSFRLKF